MKTIVLLCMSSLCCFNGYPPGTIVYPNGHIVLPPGYRWCSETSRPVPVQTPPTSPSVQPKPETPPVTPEEKLPRRRDEIIDFGLDVSKLNRTGKHYLLNGQEVSREKALQALEPFSDSRRLPNDEHKFFLVLIGSPEETSRIERELTTHQNFSPLQDRLLIRCFAPDSPAIVNRGFVTTGNPSIYLMHPSGQVLARNLDGRYLGPETLIQSLLVATRPYFPDKDPPLAPQSSPWDRLHPILRDVPVWVWIAVAGLVILLISRRS